MVLQWINKQINKEITYSIFTFLVRGDILGGRANKLYLFYEGHAWKGPSTWDKRVKILH